VEPSGDRAQPASVLLIEKSKSRIMAPEDTLSVEAETARSPSEASDNWVPSKTRQLQRVQSSRNWSLQCFDNGVQLWFNKDNTI
jgi:hypothetical protein